MGIQRNDKIFTFARRSVVTRVDICRAVNLAKLTGGSVSGFLRLKRSSFDLVCIHLVRGAHRNVTVLSRLDNFLTLKFQAIW